MATAKLVGVVSSPIGIRILYKMDPPLPNYAGRLSQPYVVLSSIENEFGKECLIFPADSSGDIADLEDMPGSNCHTTNHAEVLAALGYSIEV